MALYRTVNLSFWTDPKVDDDFTPEDKYFYLYLLTNPHTNLVGCYEVSMKQMCRETGYNEDTVLRLLDRMSEQHDVIRFSQETKEVLILNWHKYNWTSSSKVLSAVLSSAMGIKRDSFRAYIAQQLEAYGVNTDTLSIPYGYRMDTTVTVTDTVSVTDTVTDIGESNSQAVNKEGGKKERFIPPTVDEVEAYCKKLGYGMDAEHFVAYYTANGWKVGKNPMKSWQSAVVNWEKNDKERNRNNQRANRTIPKEYHIEEAF